MQKERFDKELKVRNDAVVKRLIALRTAEESFKNKYGYFTASFDTLITFLKKDSLPVVMREGILTDSMIMAGIDETAAVKMKLIRRDTAFVPVMNEIFIV